MSAEQIQYQQIFDKEAQPAIESGGIFIIYETQRESVTKTELIKLAEELGMSREEIARVVGMTGRNLQRYSNHHKLNEMQYTNMLLLTRLFIRGVDVFGNKDKFGRWLRKPVRSLGMQKPIDLLSSTVGYTVVEQVLGRIEHGVFG